MQATDRILSEGQPCLDEVAVLRAGGQESLAELFLQYRDRLERMVELRLDPRLWGRVDPADVVQEAYLEVARRIDSFLAAPQVALFVWLRQITWQKLLDTHRLHLGQKRNAAQEVSLDSGGAQRSSISPLAHCLAGSLTSPSQAAMRNERVGLLQRAIEQMDELDREVLALRHFEQLTNAQVAQVLDITKTAASNRYIRALKRLRRQLDGSTTMSHA